MTDSSYRKLTGKTRTLIGFSQVWLGGDHLLVLNSSYYVERYHRFTFSDIQAIVVSERQSWTLPLTAVLLALSSLGFALRFHSSATRVVFAATGLLALAVGVIDMVRGPRCRCVVQTAVSRERLLPVSRMRAARRFLAAVTSAIEAVQGSVPAEEIAQAQTFAATAPGSPVQPPAIRRARGYMAEVFFGLLLLDSLLVWVALRSAVGLALGLLPSMYLAEFVLSVVALVHARTRVEASSALLLAAFLCVIVDPFALSGAAGWHAIMEGLRLGMGSSGPPRLDFPIQAPLKTILLSAGWRATAGALGLGACLFERRTEGS